MITKEDIVKDFTAGIDSLRRVHTPAACAALLIVHKPTMFSVIPDMSY